MTERSPGGDMPPLERRGQLALFFTGNICLAAGLFVHAFLFNFYLRELALPASVMGHQVAAMTFGGLFALLPAALVIDRLGSRPALLCGVVVATLGLALTALARTPWTLYPAAMLIGIGGAACRVAWGPALMRLTNERNRARAFTWNVALLVGSGGVWTALAGILPQWSARLGNRTGLTGIQLTLLAGAALSATAALCYWHLRFPRETSMARPVVAIAIPTRVGAVLPFVALWMLAAALVLPFFNVFFLDRFRLPVSDIGTLFAGTQLAHAAMLVGAAELSRRWGPRRALVGWMIVLAPALWSLSATNALGLAVFLYVIQGFIAPATNPLIDQLLLERSPHEQHGLVAGWRNAVAEGAGALGASAGGRLLDATSYGTLFLVAGTVAAASGSLLIVALQARRAPSIVENANAA